ncbi:MAG: DUF4136 domain-containing protein [Vicingaceae bacterium]
MIKTILASSLMIFLFACASNVQTFNPSHNDLSNYQSFAYLPNTNVNVTGKNYQDELVNRAIVESVKGNLEEHGLILNRETPDLLVLISTSTNVELRTQANPVYATYPYQAGIGTVSPFYDSYYYYGFNTYGPIIGYNTTTYSFEEGTVVIDLIDRKTKNTVWKGIANDRIYEQTTNQAIRSMVNDIFAEFPMKEKDS